MNTEVTRALDYAHRQSVIHRRPQPDDAVT